MEQKCCKFFNDIEIQKINLARSLNRVYYIDNGKIFKLWIRGRILWQRN